jgi:hypothetical protein
MATYTVIGLIDSITGELFVAAVLEGKIMPADTQPPGEYRRTGMTRFAGFFDAGGIAEAESAARSAVTEHDRTYAPRRIESIRPAGGML